eukprot:CCRYP_010816-RA/>CCRYP_010816-RA protein AED:0.39 eAED:0.55 QI:0/0/0/1/0/0/3/0/209
MLPPIPTHPYNISQREEQSSGLHVSHQKDDPDFHNGAVLILSSIIKHVMASASKLKLHHSFTAAEAIPLRVTLKKWDIHNPVPHPSLLTIQQPLDSHSKHSQSFKKHGHAPPMAKMPPSPITLPGPMGKSLPQAGILANKLLKKSLASDGYFERPHTPGLFKHISRPVQFSLVVDNFGIKYIGRQHLEHLIASIKRHYDVTVDYTGSLY